jgi:hypothetical protein
MSDQADNAPHPARARRQDQKDWASQRQQPVQQQRQQGGSGRQDIDDSDQAVDSSGMLNEGETERQKPREDGGV